MTLLVPFCKLELWSRFRNTIGYMSSGCFVIRKCHMFLTCRLRRTTANPKCVNILLMLLFFYICSLEPNKASNIKGKLCFATRTCPYLHVIQSETFFFIHLLETDLWYFLAVSNILVFEHLIKHNVYL